MLTLRLFRVQAQVIWALIIREMHTRYGRENIGYLWIIAEPMLFTAGVTIAWSLVRPAREHGIPITAFTVTGYVPLTMWRHCAGRAVKAFEANGSLLFHRQVTPFDILAARMFLEIIGNIMAGILVAVCAIALGVMDPPKDIGLVMLGLTYQALFCFAFSMIVASFSERSDFVEKVISVLMYLAIPMSGAFMMVHWVPEQYQWILLVSPSVHNVEMLRHGQFGVGVHPIYDPVFMTWSVAVMLLVGLSLTMRSRRYIVVQ